MSEQDTPVELSAEDAKLVTLAKGTRARVGAEQGAAVRDSDGRTYAGASVALDSLSLSALQVCVAMAHASGSQGLEAAVLLTQPAGATLSQEDAAVLAEFGGPEVSVFLGDARGKTISRA